ncbi:hypothetical protein [Chryseobacterium sp. PET-29]|uniref:hypothetical protein n=1 Tax=Chryseobacterium sp. PET-29 TaxID=2983267 RepID=UPI0021E5BD57|nr:hypothetical protein [Chryseobacterium sp. PET-29]
MKKTLLALIVLMYANHLKSQDSCDKLLQDGLYQKMNITTRSSFNQDLKTYFLSEDFKNDVKKGSWGGSFSIPIEGIPFSLGMNSSDDAFSNFRRKVEETTSLSININDFVNISKQLPNASLYESYVKCKEIDSDRYRTGLVPGKKIENEETVIFTFFYRPSSPNDKAPKVKSFTIEPKSALINAGGIVEGKRIPSFLMQVVCRRSEINEIVFSLQTENGYVSDNSGPTKSSKFETPVGTIIASYLSFDRFLEAIGERGVWKSNSKWAPCDGREVANSTFSKISGSSLAPDLRGVFLRGLNSFDINPPSTVKTIDTNQKDPENRIVGSLQTDDFKNHFHTTTLNVFGHRNDGYPRQEDMDPGNWGGYMKVNTDSKGGIETRPKNISIYYYIKIN